jgi:hypothetical protein
MNHLHEKGKGKQKKEKRKSRKGAIESYTKGDEPVSLQILVPF